MLSPEPTTMERLRQTYAEAKATREGLAEMVMHDDRTGEDTRVLMPPGVWQELEGRAGVKMYPVPNPDGSSGLFAAFCWIAAGSSGSKSSTPVSQLIAMKAGELECNGKHYGPGQSLYIPANQLSDWRVGEKGYLSAILFSALPPSSPPDDDGQPSCCSITPDLPPQP